MIPEIKTVIYCTDLGAGARPIFRHAIAVAEKFGAKLVVVHAMEPLGPSAAAVVETYVPKEVADQARKDGFAKTRAVLRERLDRACQEELGETARTAELIADAVVVDGSPSVAAAILREARARKAELIVLGSHARSPLEAFLIGSTARHLTQISDIPLFMVPVAKS